MSLATLVRVIKGGQRWRLAVLMYASCLMVAIVLGQVDLLDTDC